MTQEPSEQLSARDQRPSRTLVSAPGDQPVIVKLSVMAAHGGLAWRSRMPLKPRVLAVTARQKHPRLSRMRSSMPTASCRPSRSPTNRAARAIVLSIAGDSYRMRRHRDAIAALRPTLTGGRKGGEFSAWWSRRSRTAVAAVVVLDLTYASRDADATAPIA